MVFTQINQQPRTDEDFKANKYPQHRKFNTALIQLPIDIIGDVVVADELHLLELGVVKRLITGWRTGKLGNATKWSASVIESFSKRLMDIKMPMEVNRNVRSLKVFACWKGNEFRSFLLYYGFVVLKDFLPPQNYLHFLLLFTASTICSNRAYFRYLNVAKLLFDKFITEYKRLYGSEHITSNVHNLNHVVEEVERFGELWSFSAYPFENYLGIIKRLIKGGKNPLIQASRRLSERLFVADYNYKPHKPSNDELPTKISKNRAGQVKIKLREFSLSNDVFADQWFSSESNKILCMQSAFEQNNKYFIKALDNFEFFFEQPFESTILNIYQANVSNIKTCPLLTIPISQIKFKYVAIPYKNCCIFTPLLHTLK